MVFGLFKKTDPVCGVKEQKGKGITDSAGLWFCSELCKKRYVTALKNQEKANKSGGCCCGHSP